MDLVQAEIEHDGLSVHDADVDVRTPQWVNIDHVTAASLSTSADRRQPNSGGFFARKPSLIDVLGAAANANRAPGIQGLDDRQVRWAVETGLAPLLATLTPDGSPLTRSLAWPLVRGSALAARLGSADQLEAAAQLLDACRGRVPPMALLKGISLCERDYPEPHLRPMRDLDLLVDAESVREVESALIRLGYEPEASRHRYRGHHHLVPYVHPDTGVFVEIHHRLFRPLTPLGSDPVFSEETIRSQLLDSTLRGRPVRRLSVELQVVYLAAHWASSLKLVSGTGGLLPLLDLIYLFKANEVRWPVILAWLERSAAAPSVYALLAYGSRRGLFSPGDDVLDALRRQQRAFNAVNLAVVFAVIDRCMVEGRRLAWPLGKTALQALWQAAFLEGPAWKNLARVPSILSRARHADRHLA
jgi:hypothetical protein